MLFCISRLHILSLLGFLFFLTASCSTNLEPGTLKPGTFQKNEVPSDTINSFNLKNNVLYAATDKGIFIKHLVKNIKWEYIGLDIKNSEVQDIVFVDENVIFATLNLNYNKIDKYKPDLFKSDDNGKSWKPIEAISITNRGKRNGSPSLIEKSSTKPLKLFGAGIYLSSDYGKTWQNILRGASTTFLRVSHLHPGIIWTGGVHTIFSPYLVKSEDGGKTWVRLGNWNLFNGDATVYDVVLHPENANLVLVGLSGSVAPARIIRKSTDGGQTWKTVLENISAYSLTRSARGSHIIYAGGRNAEGTLFFAASSNFGETWKVISWKDSLSGLYVNDMISVMQNGHEVLYFATNKGIYSYTFEK